MRLVTYLIFLVLIIVSCTDSPEGGPVNPTPRQNDTNDGTDDDGVGGGTSVDPAVADFRLLPNSPAVNAQQNLPASRWDISGALRDKGTPPDLGAFESY